MSKVKTTEVVDVAESVIGSIIEPMASTMAISTTKKIGVARYLEINPQSTYIANLMKKKYKMEFHTIPEWDAILDKLLGKKTS